MTINFQLTQRDFHESFRAYQKNSALARWTIRIGLTILAIALLGSFATVAQQQEGDWSLKINGWISNYLPLLGLIILWVLVIWGSPWWTARNQFKKQPAVQGPRTMTFDDSGIHTSWDGGSSALEWRNIVRFVDANNQFLLFSSPACFNIVPKRQLSSEQVSELRLILEQKLGKN